MLGSEALDQALILGYFACVDCDMSSWLSSMLGSEALDLVRTSHLRCSIAQAVAML